MRIAALDKKKFQLTAEGRLMGELLYDDFMYLHAHIIIPSEAPIAVSPVGFWGSSVQATQGGRRVAELTMTWRGNILLVREDGSEGLLKAEGILSDVFVMEGKEGTNSLRLEGSSEWGYPTAYKIGGSTPNEDVLGVLLAVYACNYLMASRSGVTSGL